MPFCPKCKKEVVQYSISSGANDSEKVVESMQSWAKKNDKLIVFNPPPFGTMKCPVCFSELS
ncbi:MAG: hypothetical protein ABID61_05570 [Candidatus Micrarchaeota archaeon]